MKLGRDWFVKAGLADQHELTELHKRPVGATTAWIRHRDHGSARKLANSLAHVLTSMTVPSPFARGDLRRETPHDWTMGNELRGVTVNLVSLPIEGLGAGWWLAGELFVYGGAYVAIVREGADIESQETWVARLARARRGAHDPDDMRLDRWLAHR